MSNTLNQAMGTAKDAIGSAKEVIESAKGGAEHAASSARSTFFDFAKFAMGVAATVRAFDRDDALSMIGLERKRGALSALPAFSAGLVVGTGLGLLFAPTSGATLRQTLLRNFNDLKREAGDKIEEVGDEVKAAEQKVEKRVGDEMKAAERKVEKRVGDVVSSVKGTIEAVEEGIHGAAAEAKSMKNNSSAGYGHSEGAKTPKTHGGTESGRSIS